MDEAHRPLRRLLNRDHEVHAIRAVARIGRTIITVDGEEQRYGPGTWYETSANEPHAVRFDVDTIQVELGFRPSEG